jgi:hypothetical protein
MLARVAAAIGSAAEVRVVRHASSPPPPPPPPPPPGLRPLRNVMFWAEVDEDDIARALAMPARWTHAVTADLGYRSETLLAMVHALRGAGRTVRPWCDCREPTDPAPGTPYRVALAMSAELGLAEPIGECESSLELGRALAAGARDMVGNPNAWTPAERAMVTTRIMHGELAVSGEHYGVHPDYSAGGVPIDSVTLGVALDAGVHVPIGDYWPVMTPGQRQTFCVYHGHRLTGDDLAYVHGEHG